MGLKFEAVNPVPAFLVVPFSLFFILISVGPALGQWSTDPALNNPICAAAGAQSAPSIISDGSGGVIITWFDRRSGVDDIYAQRIDANGVPLWTSNGVAICTATGDQQYPNITSDGSGGAIITWEDQRTGSYDVYSQRISGAGTVQWTPDGVPICTATGGQFAPTITSDGSAGAIITWYDQRIGSTDIYAQRINGGGIVQWTGDGVILCAAAFGQSIPKIISDGSGGAIITWEDQRGSDIDIYAQRVNASGLAQWLTDGVPISTALSSQQFQTAEADGNIIADGLGGAIITWFDNRDFATNGFTQDIYAQRINASGVIQWTSNGTAICTAPDNQELPTAISDGSGGAIITWRDIRNGSNFDIYGQRISGGGAVQWTSDGVAICTAANTQFYPFGVPDGSGGAVIMWQDFRNGSNHDVYAQRMNASGAAQWTSNGVAITTAAGHQTDPTIASDGSGGGIITWVDARPAVIDIYGQRVRSDGLLGSPLPTISSFSPTSGPVGTTVTITGTNFSATPANNIVFFGATQATVTAASATSLTVTVPVGATYQPITVNVGGLIAYSASPFVVTFTGGGTIDACSFAAKVDFAAGTSPFSVSIGDIDGDGMADLAVANFNASNTVSVFRNTSSGAGSINYAAKVDFTTGTLPSSVSIGDLDGDGKADLAVANYSSNTVSVFRNTSSVGSISYAAKVDFTTGTSPLSVSIGDLDGDGKADLAVANLASFTVSVLRNTSSGVGDISYAAKVDFTTGTGPESVSIGDLDGDGKADLAVANYNSNTVSVFRNTASGPGSISYAAKIDFTTGSGSGPYSVSIGDLDGDGKADLAVSNVDNNTVSVFRNTSSGAGSISYAAKVDFTTGLGPYSVSIGDLDGDGNADLAVANATSATVSVFRNTSSGAGNISYAATVDFTTGLVPYSVSIGDLDGDGKADLAVANYNSNTVSVFRNTVSSLLPTITSFTPLSGPIGTSVTITGTNFDATPANNIVLFNGTASVVSLSTATSITTTVPVGATTGTISVTVGCNTATSGAVFTVGSTATITINTQPADFTACVGQTATFTTAATGTTNITYQWQFSPDGIVPFTDIINGGGYSNATTSTLSINTTGTFGLGRYQCRINGDFAAEVITFDEGLFINPPPAAPSTSGNTACSSTTVILMASGGFAGDYRWYTVASGGTAIAGQTNDTYTTPSLTTTTTYYVALDNGTCQGPRSPVTATITALPPAPGVTPGSACAPSASMILTASGGTSGQYRWYTVPTGGSSIPGETNSMYTTPILSASTTYYVSINNGTCESNRTSILAEIKSCNVTINTAPLSTELGGQVSLNIAPLVTTIGDLIDLNSIKVTQQPISGAPATVTTGILQVDYTGISFAGTDRLTIEACDMAARCAQQEFTIEVIGDIIIYNAVSPNGDGKNDVFLLQFIDLIPGSRDNHVVIFNRWGDIVFETQNYDNVNRVFRGLNKDGNELPTGTYYYQLLFSSTGQKRTGFISLRR
ncbi:MAG: FG-GAP-like repeat-containing protein [Cytophagales bacterium]|nr:FG-GAP-like repeat-containing protein [Cytophagales bacterium]